MNHLIIFSYTAGFFRVFFLVFKMFSYRLSLFFFVTILARKGSVMSAETSPDIRRPSLFLYNIEDEESNGRKRKSEKSLVLFFCVFGMVVFFWFLENKQKERKQRTQHLTPFIATNQPWIILWIAVMIMLLDI